MTTKTIQINSDVTGRVKRILQGVEFDGQYTFITELLQNTQRAKATEAHITLDYDTMILSDNGFGCENPKDLFTLDFSGFGYGFGEGFSSVYTLLGQVKVKTLNWEASIDVERLANKRTIKAEDLEVPIQEADFHQGFIVELQSKLINSDRYYIAQEIRKVASTIKEIDFYLNGELLPKIDLFEVPAEAEFYEIFDNRFYEGMLYVTEDTGSEGVHIYYDNRFVMELNYQFSGLKGNVLIKPNKVNLKAPDRTSIIYDEKRRRFINRIQKDFDSLLIRIMKEGTSDQVEKYASVIRRYLPVEQFMRYLQIDDSIFKNQYEMRETAKDDEVPTAPVYYDAPETEESDSEFNAYVDEANTEQVDYNIDSPISNEEFHHPTFNSSAPAPSEVTQSPALSDVVAAVATMVEADAVTPQERDLKRQQDDESFTSYVPNNRTERASKEEMATISLANIKRKTNVVWVERSRSDEFESQISQYEYYGLFTFYSPHVLYDEALRHLGITHVDEVEDNAIEKHYNVRKIGAKSKKEMRAMELLQRIEELFGLSDTFYISDIDCKMFVNLNEKQIYQQKLSVNGYAKGSEIHLNRKSLHFGKLSSLQLGKEQLGIHDVKFILSNLELIVHELAHRIYLTDDNTIDHYEAMLKVQKGITNYVLLNE